MITFIRHFPLVVSVPAFRFRSVPVFLEFYLPFEVRWFHGTLYLIQNSQAVKKVCGPQKGYGEKRCEIQGGGQEMAVMVG